MNSTLKRILNIMIVIVAVVLIFQFLIWLFPVVLGIIAIALIVSAIKGNKKKSKKHNYNNDIHEREKIQNPMSDDLNGDVIDIDYEDLNKK